jgi:hypothetical protein
VVVKFTKSVVGVRASRSDALGVNRRALSLNAAVAGVASATV